MEDALFQDSADMGSSLQRCSVNLEKSVKMSHRCVR